MTTAPEVKARDRGHGPHQALRRKDCLDGLSFEVMPGTVTEFLGPNGAGKSTTMRMIVGLDRPTRARSRSNGRRYAVHAAPLREVGILLDPWATRPR